MGCGRASPALLSILNAAQIIFGLALSAVAIWLYIEVQSMTNLRNPNRYLLDYEMHWPQLLPWIFLAAGALVLIISCCGLAGARSRSQFLLCTYVIFEVILILILVTSAVISLIFATSNSTEKFIKETIFDVYEQSKTHSDVRLQYETFEKRFHCCGAIVSRDYVDWMHKFPSSCCGGQFDVSCDTSNEFANDMRGCSKVAVNYTRKAIQILAAASALTAIVGVLNLIIALIRLRYIQKKPRVIVSQHEADSKKVLI